MHLTYHVPRGVCQYIARAAYHLTQNPRLQSQLVITQTTKANTEAYYKIGYFTSTLRNAIH